MARALKIGLDYFPFNVDFFEHDAIQFLSVSFGIKGEAIAVRLMCRIYKNGYSTEFNNDIAKLFARSVGDVSLHGLVNDVVHELLRRGFFHRDIFKSFGILTSFEIQSNYQRICTDAKRKDWKIDEKINLLTLPTVNTPENSGITPEETGNNSGGNTQRKEEESKEKENTVLTPDEPAVVEKKEALVVEPEQQTTPVEIQPPPEQPKKKVAPKKKDEKPGRPFWQRYLDFFKSYHDSRKPEPYEIKPKDMTPAGEIYDTFRKRSHREQQEWTEPLLLSMFEEFLNKAYSMEWLSNHFSFHNLNNQYNSIQNAAAIQPVNHTSGGGISKAERTSSGQAAVAARLFGRT